MSLEVKIPPLGESIVSGILAAWHVADGDTVTVLDAGKVVEHGRHADLLAAGGTYARMFHLQAAQYLEPRSG